MKCSRCQHENPLQSKFCLECGARLAVRCSSCGAEVPGGAKFCNECGQALAAGVPSAVPRFGSPDSYTPKHLAEKILTSKAALEGERKQVTVLFADLKGSMELLADRDPEEARKILDPVLERMMEAVHRYEGTVNQVMGDGIMALFGAPVAHEDHAVRACYAALRMQESVKRYAERVRRSEGLAIQIRVGLNSGEVVVRSIGGDLHMDYTAVGQTTHLAARMEQAATPGSILITADGLRMVEGYVQVQPLGPMMLKGLSAPVEIYEVTGAISVRTRLQALAARGLTRFVGRETEVEQLRQALEQARAGHGQIVAVVGEPGVGKSRLLYEFTHSHRTHGWRVLESGSASHGKATAWLPVIDLLKGYFKIEDRDDTRAIRAKVTGNLLTLDGALKETIAPVLWLLDILPSDDGFQTVDPPERRRRTLDGIRRVLLRESRIQPLLLVFEDLHWIDSETQAFLDALIESLPTATIMLAVNYRPEYQHAWGNKTYYRQLRIDPLPPESVDELLRPLLGDDPALQPLKRLLTERTEGNPLFLEESVRALVESGALVGERGSFRVAKDVRAIDVPPTVQAILSARIDRLSAEDKRLLQAASVIGNDVPITLLQAIADESEDALRRGLARLQAAEFLHETQLFPDLHYTFRHALTHSVAYSALLHERRRDLHDRVVTTIERLYADRLSEHVERLAYHALHGAGGDKAVRYLRQAGAKAMDRSASQQAVEFLEHALAVVAQLPESRDTLAQTLDLRIALGPALLAAKGFGAPEAEASYATARELCRRVDDTSRLVPVLWGLWFINFNRGRYKQARDLATQLLDLAQHGDDTALLLEAHHASWTTLVLVGELTLARPHLQEGLALYEPERHRSHAFLFGGHDPGVCCRNLSALTLWLLGFPDEAMTNTQEGLALAKDLSLPLTTVLALYFAAWVQYQRGDQLTAVQHAREAVALATAQGFSLWGVYASMLLGRVMVEQGDTQTGVGLLRTSLEMLRGASAAPLGLFSRCLLAEAYAKLQQPAAGLQVLPEALFTGEEKVGGFYLPELYRLRGELLSGSLREAEACFRRAIEVARARQELSLELRAVMSLSRLLAGQNKRREACAMLDEVYGRFTEGFETTDLKAAKQLLGALSATPSRAD